MTFIQTMNNEQWSTIKNKQMIKSKVKFMSLLEASRVSSSHVLALVAKPDFRFSMSSPGGPRIVRFHSENLTIRIFLSPILGLSDLKIRGKLKKRIWESEESWKRESDKQRRVEKENLAIRGAEIGHWQLRSPHQIMDKECRFVSNRTFALLENATYRR